jgi:uracil phosphoribosyltransferase
MDEINVWKIPNVKAINSSTINRAVARMRPELNFSQGEFYKLWIGVTRELFKETINGNRKNIVPIMRAAAPLIPPEIFMYGIPVSYAWTKRDEESHIAKILNWEFPNREIRSGRELEIFDPIIASGTSLEQIFRAMRSQNIVRTDVTAGIASPEGLYYLANLCNEIGLEAKFTVGYTGNNLTLNDRKYVVYKREPFAGQPVTGDVGDRIHGT